ncbi:hypothetical protein AB0A81_37605, partial [Streptomyces flaveolus]|uniref:hypothetical protein n=1 Tax=Streptomyces flaveolus TaxID=67297 RepID=UPI003408C072
MSEARRGDGDDNRGIVAVSLTQQVGGGSFLVGGQRREALSQVLLGRESLASFTAGPAGFVVLLEGLHPLVQVLQVPVVMQGLERQRAVLVGVGLLDLPAQLALPRVQGGVAQGLEAPFQAGEA